VGIPCRDVVEPELGVAGGRQSRYIDNILDADRDAMQRAAASATEDLPLGQLGRVHGKVSVKSDERM
jgi:hypothetical protein